jgi:hypothetical protein
MLHGGVPVNRSRLRAPREDSCVLAEPPLSEIGRLLSDNQNRLNSPSLRILGRPLDGLRRDIRFEILGTAHEYMRQAGQPADSAPRPFPLTPLFLAGHQPELFHAGVWCKNFALHGLASQHGAAAINLIVDNDTVKSTALHLPEIESLDPSHPAVHRATIPFDHWLGELPYEENSVQDEELFANFAERTMAVCRSWPYTPLLPRFWQQACLQARRTPLLGERLAAARRTIERQWNCQNLELPVSKLSQTESFAWFAVHLLADLPRFHETYNAAVRDHRKQHGVRSKNHPVPDLAAEGEWLEVPLWAWRGGERHRQRLFARRNQGTIDLRAGNDAWPRLPDPNDPGQCVGAWQELEPRGFKARPRALTMTMFSRLFVGDLFIHGVGGGKYDELTDEIIRRFYGIEPPAFLILTATLLLPLPAFSAKVEQQRELHRTLRKLHYNSQRYVPWANSESGNRLVDEKLQWINMQPANRQERRERFETLRALNEKMWPFVADRKRDAQAHLAQVEAQLHANAILQRREYAFCLFPEQKLRGFYSQFLMPKPAHSAAAR